MKQFTRWMALFAALLLLVGGAASAAAEQGAAAGSTITVGVTTPAEGNYYSAMWGINTTDMDVRLLLHGTGTVTTRGDTGFALNRRTMRNVTTSRSTAGGKTYTFELADDLMYSDGSKITAADYVFTVLLQSSPFIRALGGDNTRYDALEGWAAYADGTSDAFSGVRLIDEKHFSLTIDKARLPYFYELDAVSVEPTPRAVLAPNAEVADTTAGAHMTGEWTADVLSATLLGEGGYLRRPTVVSGPYTLVAADDAAHTAEFSINPYFVGDAQGKKPQVQTLRIVPVAAGEVQAKMASGDIDVMHKVSSMADVTAMKSAQAAGGWSLMQYRRRGYGYVTINCEQDAMASKAVRQAIALCLDKDKITRDFGGALAKRAYGIYGDAQWMTSYEMRQGGKHFSTARAIEKLPKYAFNMKKAEKLLEKDGWKFDTDGKTWKPGKTRAKKVNGTLVPLVIRMGQTEGSAVAEAVANQLSENLTKLGVQFTTEKMDFARVLRLVYRQEDRANYDLFVMGTNFGEVFDPAKLFATDAAYEGVLNTTALHSKKLYKLANLLRATPAGDDETYARRWVDFQKVWADELPTIPLYTGSYVDAVSARVKGWATNSYASWAMCVGNLTVSE